MRKSYLNALAALTCAAVFAFSARPAQAQAPPDEMTIDGCAATQAGVAFPHKAHIDAGAECTTCHHSQEGLTLEAVAGGMEVEGCASCHLEPEEEATPNCSEKSLKTNAFHVLCVGCHKEKNAEDESLKAPAKCAECHPKEEKPEG
ncbi:MAG: cytochrome c3 family protein [Gemmatimonadota bacterium]|jgi:hypothetical protein|nr:MAG: cytochrome c3 family protein [Gemmatimonadota bacterium]